MDNILKEINTIPGHIGFYYKNMVTDECISFNENHHYIPASVIKLPIVMEIFRLSAKGKVSLDSKLLVKDEDKMPSCGALNSFTGELWVDIRTLCNLMITISDNTATNVLISYFGTDTLNEGFQSIGLTETRVNRRLFDAEASEKGIQNVITPAEIGMLLERLYRNEFVNQQVSEDIKEILFRQQIKHKIKELLPVGTKVGSKTGDDDNISNDVGIVYAKQPFVVCFISNETVPSLFNPFIRKTSLELFNRCNK
ncbi:serine hydrolase [Aminipila terrae]|uniref:Serine hydrolase n=1 Tax=Aminipila terrae TaxID=2697030 RepID=A0A6P1M9W5_9FIRM|nr:serine hydrolase [Aminipila terrae]QHI71499.1 serine hydrolase [Aminipila terrae]